MESNTNISNTQPTGSGSHQTVNVRGRALNVQWRYPINEPYYFWDNDTHTLGLEGDWTKESGQILRDKLVQLGIYRKIHTVYIGKNFRMYTECPLMRFINTYASSIDIQPGNPWYNQFNGILMRYDEPPF